MTKKLKLFSTDRSEAGRAVVLTWRSKMYWGRLFPLHAAKDGGPVRKGESSWRTFNGFGFRIRGRTTFIQFRRFWRI